MEANERYRQLVNDAILRVQSGRLNAYRAVNKEQIQLYWDLGRMIVERQRQYGWGKSVVENLSVDLKKVFQDISGFSPQNLWYMRQFYLEYQDDRNLQPLVGEISWSKHIVILSKVKNPQERLFYIHKTREAGWTKSVLIHQIENQTYQKVLLGQHNYPETLPQNLGHL